MSTPPTPDQAAAHQLLTELRTRIATQPLPYQYGVETRALESMREVFDHTRAAIKDHPGCERFADRATEVLNGTVRPLTAKWHRAYVEGRLNGRDGADEFRGELEVVRKELSAFAADLHVMAYGTAAPEEKFPPVMPDSELDALFKPLKFGCAAPAVSSSAPWEKIAEEEAGAVAVRRQAKAISTEAGMDAVGLALSGGGIRSATFCLGVAQALAEKGFLKEVDFLSTVSGGGYAGCLLTQRLGQGEKEATVAAPHGPDPEPLQYVRQHAKYLAGRNLKENWSMVTATLAGMLLNWTAPLAVIAGLACIYSAPGRDQVFAVLPNIFLASTTLCLLAVIAYAMGIRENRKISAVTGGILGFLVAFMVTIGAAIMLNQLVHNVPPALAKIRGAPGGIGAILCLAVTAAPGIIRFLPVLKNPAARKAVLKVLLLVAGLVVPLIAFALFYLFQDLGTQRPLALLGVVFVFAFISIFLVNANLTAPHRLYRDCLARTFIQRSEDETLDAPLTKINPENTGPYHIINAALNVPSSESAALKDRGCDFFMFSKLWTGAPSIGYWRTGEWKTNGGPLDLATAMAVSGAAFSSHMGLGSMPTLTALLTLLNVRLGFWIKKPSAFTGLGAPGFGCLLREMFSVGMSEKAPWLNLSDGGHIENMGMYELLRRRCKFIVCVDGEADPDYTFQGLMTVVRHAQIDFGLEIKPLLDEVRPAAETNSSRCHFHFCRIHYTDGGTGLLLYIKLSITGDESELIKRYRINHPDFPHQTTLDQFFDQEQFEAYRQLGVHAAEGLFKPALMSGLKPGTIPEWFRSLASNLLTPAL